MVEVRQGVASPVSEQVDRRQERLNRVRAGRAHKAVRVLPKNDIIRRDIKHGVTGARFPKEGSVEWPWDSFTKRRLRDGDIMLEPEKRVEEAAPSHRGGARTHRAAARED